MRFRIFCASVIVFSWKQCSRPGTPCVLEVEPTAMTSLSYLGQAQDVSAQRHEARGDDARNVHVLALATSGSDGLDLEQTLGHDKVYGARIDEMAAETCRDLSEGFDKRAD